MSDKVRIAVVGGGRAGTPLIEEFLRRPFVEIVGVADKDGFSPGVTAAKAFGIPHTGDFLEFAAPDANVDVIVEVSGDPAVKPALKDAFVAQNNRHTVILHDIVARTMISMAQNSDELVESVHPTDSGIG